MRNSVRKAIEARIGPAIAVGPVDGRSVRVQLCPSLKDVLYRIVLARSDMFLAWHRHDLLFLAFLLETDARQSGHYNSGINGCEPGRTGTSCATPGLGEQTIFFPIFTRRWRGVNLRPSCLNRPGYGHGKSPKDRLLNAHDSLDSALYRAATVTERFLSPLGTASGSDELGRRLPVIG